MTSEANVDAGTAILAHALKKSGAGYLYQSDDQRVVLSGNLPDCLQSLATPSPANGSVLGTESDLQLAELKRGIVAHGDTASMDVDIPAETETVTYRIDLERVDSAGMTGILSVIFDISEHRHREQVLNTLLRELSHRSKNLLAIIQGIATQTARQAMSLDYFLTKFRGRIQSLAHSQDLVTDSSWRGAYLDTLAERQLHAHWPGAESRIKFTGVNAYLSPNATLHIGLALHELIVNSTSHGALSSNSATVTVACSESILGGQKALQISWMEKVPNTAEKDQIEDHPFARIVLERVVPIAVGGKALYSINQHDIDYRLTVPSREYEIRTSTS